MAGLWWECCAASEAVQGCSSPSANLESRSRPFRGGVQLNDDKWARPRQAVPLCATLEPDCSCRSTWSNVALLAPWSPGPKQRGLGGWPGHPGEGCPAPGREGRELPGWRGAPVHIVSLCRSRLFQGEWRLPGRDQASI